MIFYDSASPEAIPSGVLAMAYVGGSFAWPESQAKRMHRIFRLTEVAGATNLARYARGIAVEPGAASLEEAIVFARARHSFGHKDFTLYTSLGRGSDPSHQPGFAAAVQAFHAEAPHLPVRYWIAEWDGNPNARPSANGAQAWAKQYLGNVHGGAYDLNVLYGIDDLVRP